MHGCCANDVDLTDAHDPSAPVVFEPAVTGGVE
jgi:hypothetical protein